MINWEAIGAVGEVVGALAVVVSIVYLAIQIRQSGRIGRFTAHQNLTESLSSIIEPFYSDAQLSRIWQLADDAPEQMTPEQRERFGIVLYSVFGNFYNAHLLAEVDPGLSRQFVRMMDRFLVRKGVQAWWERQGKNFDKEFSSVVDERLRAIASRSDDATT